MPKILKTRSKVKKESKPLVVYLFCALRGVLLSFCVFSLVSLLLLNNSSFTVFTKVILYFGIALGSVLCGFLAHRKLKGKGIMNGLVSSIFFSVIFIIVVSVFLKFGVSKLLLLTVPLVVLGCVTGGVISANK